MLNAEEIAIKLNIDVSDAEKMRRSLTSAGKEAHSSFLHGDSAAKGFKKTLHELTDAIPGIGWALRALVSWQGAAFAALAAGIGYATKAIDEYNKKLDETAAKNAEPINSAPASKWRGIYRVRDAVAQASGAKSPITPTEAKRQAEAEEKWEAEKQRAADLVKVREKEVADAQAKYKGKETPGSPWYREAAGMANAALLFITGQWGANPNAYVDAATFKKQAESDKLYRDKLEAEAALRRARDQAGKLEGQQPATINRGLWQLLGLRQAVGWTAQAAVAERNVMQQRHLNLDPETGGIKYNPVDFKPLKGALGYVAKPPSPGEIDRTTKPTLEQEVAVALMQAFRSGFPVTGKD